jgi:hypothetical protein
VGAIKTIPGLSIVLFTALSAQGQDGFQNLNFEAANVSGYSAGSSIPASLALPGWTAYLTDTSTSTVTPESQVVYDGISTGGPVISVIDANSGFAPLQGNYSVFLFGGALPRYTLHQ